MVAVEKKVLGLEVAVAGANAVQVRDGGRGLADEHAGAALVAAAVLQECKQLWSPHILHHNAQVRLVLGDLWWSAWGAWAGRAWYSAGTWG